MMKFVNPKNDVVFRKEFGLTEYEYSGMRIQDERGALVHAREEGRQAEKLEIACKMKQEGLQVALIAKVMGLTALEIERL